MVSDFSKRRKFFELYCIQAAESIPGLPPNNQRVTCPCCGFPTLAVSSTFGLCELCDWEDDGQDDPNAKEVIGGPNQDYSLTEARGNFERYLVMYRPEDHERFLRHQSEQRRAIKGFLIATFEWIMNEPRPDELDRLWAFIVYAERQLSNP